jgi:hypothetical protein
MTTTAAESGEADDNNAMTTTEDVLINAHTHVFDLICQFLEID